MVLDIFSYDGSYHISHANITQLGIPKQSTTSPRYSHDEICSKCTQEESGH